MKDWSLKKAAKILLKRAKAHPEWYTKDDIKYAKMAKKRLKQEKKDAKRQSKDKSK